MKTSDFKKGMRVKYFPKYVSRGNREDDEYVYKQFGCVSSTNDKWVFVKYDIPDCKMITGDEPYTAQATPVECLERI